ncbi:Inosine/uridine-preferring nucleoside hydrolase domain-containing protein [Plasmodiophora brassicae]|uniref:Inosine/uridine-preferring nucleoside hydrolase domain-containing protein n=1 Tax=Plasmodiophora brassicae TaxID=37360 RepID=A0A0G4J3W6_PLABS|nr:hypothetical protein PBRA_002339 [Plasmodiophora brassicae]SPQ98926.1 unnamed protein product [Plasmodiophora brassicae]
MDVGEGGAGRRLVIVDTDGGVDDAVAVIVALKSESCDVLALTAVAGNVGVDQAARNMSILVQLFAKSGKRVPVFAGADRSLLGERSKTFVGHGANGLGDADISAFINVDSSGSCPIESEHAVLALVRLSKEYSGKIELIAVGPLTNVALAQRLDPGFLGRLHSLTIMGGAVHARGNETACAEFNIFADPEAAHIVLSSADQVRMLIVAREPIVDSGIAWEMLDELSASGSRAGAFIVKIFESYQRTVRHAVDKQKQALMYVFDAWALMAALDPSVILESVIRPVHVELSGRFSRGLTIVDWDHKTDRKAAVTIAMRLDGAAIWQEIRRHCHL